MSSPALQAWHSLRKLWPYAAAHRATLAWAFVCMAVLGLTTGAYAVMMGPALRFLLTGGENPFGVVGEWFPALASLDRAAALWALPAVIVGLAVFKGVAYLGQFSFMALFGQRVGPPCGERCSAGWRPSRRCSSASACLEIS